MTTETTETTLPAAPSPADAFWAALETAVDPTTYRPRRNTDVEVVRLQSNQEAFYVLKQPQTRAYLRLAEADYALWWQMTGEHSLKELLFYSLRRYQTLPIGHLTGLINDLRSGGFLTETPVNVYDQVEMALEETAPASRGRRIINGFLHSEFALEGLDDFFTPLYRQTRPIFSWLGRQAVLLLTLVGGFFFFLWFWAGQFRLTGQGGFDVLGLFVANLIVILIHELAHGLAVKHYGRELHRGGFMIYWGIPAFFVDTRDTWMLSNRKRIGVSWAGPYSGLLLGGLAGLILTAVILYAPNQQTAFWVTLIYQIGFIGYLSAFINLNPLLELDGYFMLMDWLEMPGLRGRAFRYWRESVWSEWKTQRTFKRFWAAQDRPERIFLLYGALAFVYSVYALRLAWFFWSDRLGPFLGRLWQGESLWGQLFVLLLTAVVIVPTVYYLIQYGWSRIEAGLEWLSNRNLLARPDMLALIIGVPLLSSVTLTAVWMWNNPAQLSLLTWLIHLSSIGAIIGIARQLPGSRFQWVLWSLTAVPLLLKLASLTADTPFVSDLFLLAFALVILLMGVIAWLTVSPDWLELGDRATMGLMVLGAPATYWLSLFLYGTEITAVEWRWLTMPLMQFALFLGLMFLSPLLINFRHSRFGLSWLLLVVAILLTPWAQFEPWLHLPLAALWLYALLHYLVVGALAQFQRIHFDETNSSVYDERSRLVVAFNNFLNAMFNSYNTVFGGRRLQMIQDQVRSLGVLDPDLTILQIADRAREGLHLVVDRLDDLAGTPFTLAVGQAAYDSLPWLQAETLGRQVLAESEWGSQLAAGFIQLRDRRRELLRRADIFAAFDEEALESTLEISRQWNGREGAVIAQQGDEASAFYLIESGEVAILHQGAQVGKLTPGGYLGTMALLPEGPYQFTYRTLSRVTAVVIDRDQFDPLLRADTTLSKQVSSGAAERRLLKQMPLFSSLSPQQIATIDAQLKHRAVRAGETIVSQGQPRTDLFIIAQGAVNVLFSKGETEERVGRLGPGEHFGEYALFADTPYHATYVAAEDTQLLLLNEPTFDALVEQCERMSHYVEQIGSGRLVATRRRLGLTAVV